MLEVRDQVVSRSSVCGWPTFWFSHDHLFAVCFHMAEGTRDSLGPLSRELHLHDPISHSPAKVQPPNKTNTFGVRTPGDIDILTRAHAISPIPPVTTYDLFFFPPRDG